jgi:hypothetical protein
MALELVTEENKDKFESNNKCEAVHVRYHSVKNMATYLTQNTPPAPLAFNVAVAKQLSDKEMKRLIRKMSELCSQ